MTTRQLFICLSPACDWRGTRTSTRARPCPRCGGECASGEDAFSRRQQIKRTYRCGHPSQSPWTYTTPAWKALCPDCERKLAAPTPRVLSMLDMHPRKLITWSIPQGMKPLDQTVTPRRRRR